jgi:hypothetical protein
MRTPFIGPLVLSLLTPAPLVQWRSGRQGSVLVLLCLTQVR